MEGVQLLMATTIAFLAGTILSSMATFLIVGASKNNAIIEAYEEGYRDGLNAAGNGVKYDEVR